MYNNYHGMAGHGAMIGNVFGLSGDMKIGLVLLILWSLAWKGWALWLAARRHEKVWFIVLLIVNTAGILEIIYIFAIAKQKDRKQPVIEIIQPKPNLPSDTPPQP